MVAKSSKLTSTCTLPGFCYDHQSGPKSKSDNDCGLSVTDAKTIATPLWWARTVFKSQILCLLSDLRYGSLEQPWMTEFADRELRVVVCWLGHDLFAFSSVRKFNEKFHTKIKNLR